ncbi:MAG: glycosyltransferase family 4 protein [Flammeovirgaceae bacterium]
MKKLLHIHSADKGGGAEIFAYSFLELTSFESCLFVKKKYTNHPKVFQINRPIFSKFIELVDKVLYKIFKRTLFANFSVLYPIHNTWKNLSKLPQYQEADAVVLHNLHSDFFDLDALRQIARQKPMFWVMHDMWVMTGGEVHTFEDNSYQKGIAQTPYFKLYPLCHPLIDRRKKYLDKKKRLFYELKNQMTFVPVSHWLSDCLRNSYIYHPEMKIKTILNGIDNQIFKNLDLRNWQTPRILIFNSDNPFKGINLFKNILFKIEIPFELITVGSPIKGFLPQKVFPLTNDRLKLNQYYNNADIMIFPSLAENFPLTVLEAMSAGLVVIASRVGGIIDQIDEKTGFLFEKGSETDLLDKITEVLKMNLSLVRSMGREASKRVNENYTIKIMEKNYDKLFSERILT